LKNETISTLVPSTKRGRYALDDSQTGHDLTSGEVLALLLGGQWIEGRVEHSRSLYASERSGQMEKGYYFIDSNGQICGLCTGMKIRLL
jgi:Domain of unknown function (DUF5348)